MSRRGDRLGIVMVLICAMSGCGRPSPLDRVLEGGAGPVDADAPEEFTTTDSGLGYRVLRKGNGQIAQSRDTVAVRYVAWFDNGTQFDSTYGQIAPVEVPLSEAIPAMREGMQYVSEGGMIVLDVPSELGYGSGGREGVVPPDKDLNYLIELVSITRGFARVEPGPADPDAPSEFSTTDSGLRYRILRKSDGPKPKVSDKVSVHYRGSLKNGTIIDSSYYRGEPFDMAIDQVFEGWKEGMTLIGVGGMIELEIPSELGYGTQGNPPRIPPNADLRFLVELLEIKSDD